MVRLPQPGYLQVGGDADAFFPEELPADLEFEEGAATQVLVNRYERDPQPLRTSHCETSSPSM